MSNDANCPYCHEPIRPGVTVIRCPVCDTGHHKECWYDNNHRCAVYRCAGRGEGVVLGATATTAGAPPIFSQAKYGDKVTGMKQRPLTAIKEGRGDKKIECPHCGGTTVCNLWGDGSCAYCRGRHGLPGKGNIVICTWCDGSGEIELPYSYTICRHCGGTGHCQHGTGLYASCVTCLNATNNRYAANYTPRELIDEAPEEPVRCSICQGQGFRT